LGRFEAAKEVIENAPLVPAWEAKFRSDAIVRSAYHGTHLEGNGLNFSEADRCWPGGKIIGRERDIQEVLNYRNVLHFNPRIPQKEVTEEAVQRIHELTVQRILPDDAVGVYRKSQVVVKNSQTGEITFRPPPPAEVPILLDDFLRWVNQTSNEEVHSALKAGVVHYEMVRIHPFLDGNGRVARATATMVLCMDGYDVKRFFSLEEHYDREPLLYYEALQSVARKRAI